MTGGRAHGSKLRVNAMIYPQSESAFEFVAPLVTPAVHPRCQCTTTGTGGPAGGPLPDCFKFKFGFRSALLYDSGVGGP